MLTGKCRFRHLCAAMGYAFTMILVCACSARHNDGQQASPTIPHESTQESPVATSGNLTALSVQDTSSERQQADSSTRPRPASGPTVEMSHDKPNLIRALVVRPDKDNDGRLPRDVVRAFFDDVAKGDVEGARAWWIDDPYWVPLTPRLAGSFETYFEKLRSMDKLTVGLMGKGKGPYTLVYFQAFGNSGVVWEHAHYGLLMIDGRWRISRTMEW